MTPKQFAFAQLSRDLPQGTYVFTVDRTMDSGLHRVLCFYASEDRRVTPVLGQDIAAITGLSYNENDGSIILTTAQARVLGNGSAGLAVVRCIATDLYGHDDLLEHETLLVF